MRCIDLILSTNNKYEAVIQTRHRVICFRFGNSNMIALCRSMRTRFQAHLMHDDNLRIDCRKGMLLLWNVVES